MNRILKKAFITKRRNCAFTYSVVIHLIAIVFICSMFMSLANAQVLVIPSPKQPLLPQNEVQAEAHLQAKIDASWQKQRTWGVYGFFTCGLSSIVAIVPPTIPADRFVGKSPQYILHYTHVYKKRVGVQRAVWSSIGGTLGLASCIGGAYFVQFILDSTSTTD